MDDHQINCLIERCRKNDTKAFRFLVEHYQQMIFHLAFRLLGDVEDAKDIVQETFIKSWLAIDSYNPDFRFSTWLYKIAWNTCQDLQRKRKYLLNFGEEEWRIAYDRLSSGDNIEHNLINQDLRKLILTFTQELTPKQKLVFILKDLEEMEVNEIGTISGLSPAQIKSNLYLARKHIRRKLEEMEN